MPQPVPLTRAPWLWPGLIAHRGGGHLAPENTLAAFRTGAAHGYAMMEYDVKISRDGVPVLLHDDTLERTSTATGRACDHTLAQLLEHDFGAWYGKAFAGEPVATLYAIARFTRANGLASNIEIKPDTGLEEETGRIVALEAARLWEGEPVPPLLSSFSEAALDAARHAAPHLPRALLLDGALPGDWQERVRRLGCVGVNLDDQHVTQAHVGHIVESGHTVVIWTVNELQRAQALLEWGCHAVVTDALDALQPIMQTTRPA